MWNDLLEEYVAIEKSKAVKEADNMRSQMQYDLESLVKSFLKSSKIKTFSLFKQKYKSTPKYKKASKYFDPESIFKDLLLNKATGNLSSTSIFFTFSNHKKQHRPILGVAKNSKN